MKIVFRGRSTFCVGDKAETRILAKDGAEIFRMSALLPTSMPKVNTEFFDEFLQVIKLAQIMTLLKQ